MRRCIALFLSVIQIFSMLVFSDTKICAKKQGIEGISAKSYVLMEAATGKIILEKQKDLELMPASITKIMTLLLIFDALESKRIKIEDEVTVSKHASSMGGSQVYLEEGEKQSVKELIKCIAIASANDACVAMAEYIAGSEEAFVKQMNQKAKKLGMKHSSFSNCCGLDDALSEKQHFSSAYDIALMSRELLLNYEEIKEYSTTWMDSILHSTKKGEKEFGLTNTNKLVRTYEGITGLKTGSTSKAKYCLSASAKREGMELIAVVMASAQPNTRFEEAASLLDFGFLNCELFEDTNKGLQGKYVPVKKGRTGKVKINVEKSFWYACTQGEKKKEIQKKIKWEQPLYAPVVKGQIIGRVEYSIGAKQIGEIELLAEQGIEKARYLDYMQKCVMQVLF